MKEGKSFGITQDEVLRAYKHVKAKKERAALMGLISKNTNTDWRKIYTNSGIVWHQEATFLRQ